MQRLSTRPGTNSTKILMFLKQTSTLSWNIRLHDIPNSGSRCKVSLRFRQGICSIFQVENNEHTALLRHSCDTCATYKATHHQWGSSNIASIPCCLICSHSEWSEARLHVSHATMPESGCQGSDTAAWTPMCHLSRCKMAEVLHFWSVHWALKVRACWEKPWAPYSPILILKFPQI